MNIIFCGNMYSDVERDIKKIKSPPPVSSHKYQENLIRGMLANNQRIHIVNVPRLRYFPYYSGITIRKCSFTSVNDTEGVNIGFINLPVLNYITQRIMLKNEIMKQMDPNDTNVLLCFNNYLPINQAMLYVRKKYSNVLICSVLGDLHGEFGVKVSGRYDGLKGKIISRIEAKQDYLSSLSDAFGFLTTYMADALQVSNKPYVVVEGIYSGEKKEIINIDSEVKTIFYAGALEEEYGVSHLIRAFSLIKDSSYRLVLAGNGGLVSDIKKYAQKDKRLSYLGYITPEEVELQQKNATCLINPRTSNHEYVKYAFPSKNMECLASGKPYIAHDLPCNPPEYKKYMQCPLNETDEALADEIIRICSLSAIERTNIGAAAQNFILNNKNPQVQCSRIIDMLTELVNCSND